MANTRELADELTALARNRKPKEHYLAGDLVGNDTGLPMCVYDNAEHAGVIPVKVAVFNLNSVGLVLTTDGKWVLVMCDDKLGWIQDCYITKMA